MKEKGFTYLGLLFFVASSSVALAALGQSWSTAAQREKERELEFRGNEIARAISSYVRSSPSQSAQYPRSFDDLLIDRRGPQPKHHLRRLYIDPFTNRPDWELVPDPSNPETYSGVRSRSERVLLRISVDDSERQRARDRLFVAH